MSYVPVSPHWFADEVASKYHAGLKYQYFADMDFLAHSPSWIGLLPRLLSTYDIGEDFSFSIEARVSGVRPEVLRILTNAGLSTVKLGVEGATDNLLKLYKKGTSMSEVARSIRTIKSFGLKTVVYLLLGHPEAKISDYEESLHNARALEADYYVINLACPYKGTQLYNMVEQQLIDAGLIKDGIEHGMTHLSDDLRRFWNIPQLLFDSYLNLSRTTTKEDHGVGQKRYVENIL